VITPDECKPGTVVMFACGSVGVVRGNPYPVDVADRAVAVGEVEDANGVKFTHLFYPLLSDLQLAPRFLVGGEWQAVSGDPDREMGHVSWDSSWLACYFQYGDPVLQVCPTYAAAREAVERAVGRGKS
jgi:hypothetical protein